MRFATKVHRWLLALLAVAFVILGVIMPLKAWFAPGPHPPALPVFFLPWAIWSIVLPCTLPQYYEVREDGLFIRQGWPKGSVREHYPLS